MDNVKDIDNAVDFNFAIMQACIETIYDGEAVYKPQDFSMEELKEYIDSLDIKTYQSVQLFIEAMPRVEHTIGYTNSNGKEVKITLKTLTDFFTLG